MKKLFVFALAISLLTSCDKKDPDPEVHTVYARKSFDSHDAQRASASLLYDAYMKSDKSQRFYEVVYKKVPCFILNYYPEKELLSLRSDKGEGWGWQFKNVDEKKLKELKEANFTFEEWREKALMELKHPEDFSEIKTNDDPLKLR